MRTYLITIMLLFICFATRAQTIINNYAEVLSYNSCVNSFSVDLATAFSIGDTILIIQMKGAVIDSSNTAGFGNVNAYNGAGNYELNVIKAKSGNTITLRYKLKNTYNIPGGRVQVVRVPRYQNHTVSTPHTCAAWDGKKGGVFAITVSGTLTLNSDINVSGKGFRGANGPLRNVSPYPCGISGYYNNTSLDTNAAKGEGITELSTGKSFGKGKLANGGGGANAHNAGGGGGGNGAAGGRGGAEFDGCNANPNNNITGGIGGLLLNYSNTANKIFLGGGGGAGQSNNPTTPSGGNGGGIVIIFANTLTGSGNIISDGNPGAPCSYVGGATCADGMGGGGAGGTVILDVNTISGAIGISLKGGKGADYTYPPVSCGPGGGGSGGVLWLKSSTTPAAVTGNLAGGANGQVTNSGSAWGATPGSAGQTLYNLSFTPPAYPADTFTGTGTIATFTDTITTCTARHFIDQSTSSVAIGSRQWTFSNGTNSALPNPQVNFGVTGTFTAKLVVTDAAGCKDSVTKNVVVTNPLNAAFGVGNAGCLARRFTDASTIAAGNIATWQWDFGNGNMSALQNPIHNFAATGTYTVRLIVTSNKGCSDTVTQQVIVTKSLAAMFNEAGTGCLTRQFTDASTGGPFSTWEWNFGNGNTSTQQNPSYTFPSLGSYNVRLIVTDTSGCKDTLIKQVVIQKNFTPDFDIDTVSCTGRRFTDKTTITTGNIASWQWDFGNGNNSGQQKPTDETYGTTGSYAVKLVVTDNNGCKDSITKNIDISSVKISFDTSTMCQGDTIKFAEQYFHDSGTYEVVIPIAGGCDSVIKLRLDYKPKLFADFTFSPIIPETNTPTSFFNTSSTAERYRWSFGDNTFSNEYSPVHQFTRTGTYNVCLTAMSPEACPDTMCKQVEAEVKPAIGVPGAFTPNGDGVNDVLYVRGAAVRFMKFTVYNRWGQAVFLTEDMSKGWDGNLNGQAQSTEAFAYVLSATFIDGTEHRETGHITLLR